nr:MAG TPA: hypothetical protein [Caudoviricetes sp.]
MLFLEKYGSYYNELDKRTIRDEDYDVLKNRYDIANKLPQIHFTQGNKVWMPIQYIKGTKEHPDYIQRLYHNVFQDIFYSDLLDVEKEKGSLPVATVETLNGLKTDRELDFASNIIQLFNFLSQESKALIISDLFRAEYKDSKDDFKAYDHILDNFTFTRKDGTVVLYVLMDLNDTVGDNTFEKFLSEASDISNVKAQEVYDKYKEREESTKKALEEAASKPFEEDTKEEYERQSLKGHELRFDFDADNESIPNTRVPRNIKVVEFLGYKDLDGNYTPLELSLEGEEEDIEIGLQLNNGELLTGHITKDGQFSHLKTTWDNLSFVEFGYTLIEEKEEESHLSNEELIYSHKEEIKAFLLDIYNTTLPLGIIDTNLKSDFIKVLREIAKELHEEEDDNHLSYELGLIADLEDGQFLDAILLSSTYHRLLQIEGKTYSDDILYRLQDEKEPDLELFKGEFIKEDNLNTFSNESEEFYYLLPSGYAPTGIKGVFLNTGEYIDANYHPLNVLNLSKDEDQIVIDLRLTKEGSDDLNLIGTFKLYKDELGNREVRVLLKGSTEIAYAIVEYKDTDFIEEINAMEENLNEMEKEVNTMGKEISDLEKRINDIEEGMSSTIGEALENSNTAIEDDSTDPVEELLNSAPTEEVPNKILDTIKPKGEAVAVDPRKVSLPEFLNGKIGGYDPHGMYKIYEIDATIIDGKLQITSLEIKEDK